MTCVVDNNTNPNESKPKRIKFKPFYLYRMGFKSTGTWHSGHTPTDLADDKSYWKPAISPPFLKGRVHDISVLFLFCLSKIHLASHDFAETVTKNEIPKL